MKTKKKIKMATKTNTKSRNKNETPRKARPSPPKSKAHTPAGSRADGRKPKRPAKTAPPKDGKARAEKPKPAATTETTEPKRVKLPRHVADKYRVLLLDLRDHLIDGVNFLASDNLKRSSREVSGELSGYSLHMADAGTDNFDREFALSLVSSEQEALYEIEEALKRLEHGDFGICAVCEKAIPSERLEAVPFARMCVPCQSNMERDRHQPAQPATVFSDTADEDGGEGEESEE